MTLGLRMRRNRNRGSECPGPRGRRFLDDGHGT